MNSNSVENYLKAILSLTKDNSKGVNTNSIATKLNTKASSVTDMLKKLDEKELVNYKKYQGVLLTKKGKDIALNILRKHRLWEVFLVEKLKFKWDEVHDMAEQLEHIQAPELTKRLDNFLGNPKFDPHGDPIPDSSGNITDQRETLLLSELSNKEEAIIVGVRDSSADFLQYLEKQELTLGIRIKTLQTFDYDNSILLKRKESEVSISQQVSNNILVKKL